MTSRRPSLRATWESLLYFATNKSRCLLFLVKTKSQAQDVGVQASRWQSDNRSKVS